ncbi:hypothetical protein R1sor_020241 [Riccia sorocarpa]|uniref:Uncharacterized protein n=1 Tax=Riccia sorocarpa TaxID=122646 RepID=A0ABD3IGF8_9MARC
MTRPPRPKYPSDAKKYREQRRPGYAHTVRLPEELLETYAAEPMTVTNSQGFAAEDEAGEVNRDMIEEDLGAESPADVSAIKHEKGKKVTE